VGVLLFIHEKRKRLCKKKNTMASYINSPIFGMSGMSGFARPPPPDEAVKRTDATTDTEKSLHDMECLFCLENVYEEHDHVIDIYISSDSGSDSDSSRSNGERRRPPSVCILGLCRSTNNTRTNNSNTNNTNHTNTRNDIRTDMHTDTDDDDDADADEDHDDTYAYAFETDSDSADDDGETICEPTRRAAAAAEAAAATAAQLAAPPPGHILQNCGGLFSCECAVYTHPTCLQTWLLHNQSCPMCKTPLARAATRVTLPPSVTRMTPRQLRIERHITAIGVIGMTLVCGGYILYLFV
jgi:hypothetical protein